jgi:hypothetical protein
MHVFTDSKVALRDAVTRQSKRLSSWELLNLAEKDRALRPNLISSGQKNSRLGPSSSQVRRCLTSTLSFVRSGHRVSRWMEKTSSQ